MLQNAINLQWNAGKVLAEALSLLADIDDLQSAVCILIVLGDRRNDIPIDESIHVSEILWSKLYHSDHCFEAYNAFGSKTSIFFTEIIYHFIFLSFES